MNVQKLKDIVKGLKDYIGLAVGLCGVLNTYLHVFMPLAPPLRLQTNIILILLSVIAAGVTVTILKAKAGSTTKRGWAAAIFAVVGFMTWGTYEPFVSVLERHSRSQFASQLFDAFQIGAYTLPFLSWGISATILLFLFL